MDKTTHQTLPCVCGRLPTVDYHRGMMLWRPSCANPACAVHAHSFPLFANESGAVAAWNMHVRLEKNRLSRKQYEGVLL